MVKRRSHAPTVTQIYRQATTMTLAAIVACQIGNLFACRFEWVSAFQLSWFKNRLLWLGMGVEYAALLAFICFVPLGQIFARLRWFPGSG